VVKRSAASWVERGASAWLFLVDILPVYKSLLDFGLRIGADSAEDVATRLPWRGRG
jgi:hypothetical protein